MSLWGSVLGCPPGTRVRLGPARDGGGCPGAGREPRTLERRVSGSVPRTAAAAPPGGPQTLRLLQALPPPPAVWRWAVTAPPRPRPPPARVHARLSRGAAGPLGPGFWTWTARAGCEGGLAEGCTDRGAGKADLGYGFAVWPWASHSTSPPRVLPNPHAELAGFLGIPEVSLHYPLCLPLPKPQGLFVPAPARV